MALWDTIKASVAEAVKLNGNEEITGQVLQDTLVSMINALGEHATFAGLAEPSTAPGTPDGPVFYVSTETGTYSNFGGLSLSGVCFIVWDGEKWGGVTLFDSDTVTEYISDLIDRVNNLEQGYSSVSHTLEEQASLITGINSSIQQLESGQETQDGKISSLEESLSGLEESLEPVAQQVIELAQSQEEQDSQISALEAEVFPLTVSFSASSTLLEYTGEEQSVTLSWSITRKGSSVTPDSVVITYGSGTEVYNGADSSGSAAVSLNLQGSRAYAITVKSGSLTATSTATVRMLAPMYCGFSDVTEAADLDIASLEKQSVKTSPAGTYTLDNGFDGDYLWICVPGTGMSLISRVTLNGFDVPMESFATGRTDIADYYCYRSSNALVAGTYTFVVE